MTSFPTLPEHPPERPNLVGAPVNPVFILKTGQVIPIGLRKQSDGAFAPIIEGDLKRLLPLVIGIDAESWIPGTRFRLPNPEGIDAQAWARRLLDNSPILKPGSTAVHPAWQESK